MAGSRSGIELSSCNLLLAVASVARFVDVTLPITGNCCLILSGIASTLAYSSGDASGLQYILLYPALCLAFVSGAALLPGAVRSVSVRTDVIVPWVNLSLAAAAIAVASLPELTGLGYMNAVLDRVGA